MSRPASFSLTNPSAFDGKAQVYNLSELLAFPPPTWLIAGLVPNEAMVGLAGPPGVGKSMLALDWALCVATGRPWMGHPVEKGGVLYIAAEGHTGLSVRAKAWLAHHGIHPGRVPKFGLLKGRLSITGAAEGAVEDEYDTLFKRIDEEFEWTPRLVIIDTMARCLEGNENENEGMGGFLDGAERLIDAYKSTVLVIHHKNAAGTRERGHGSFRGTLGSLFFFEPVPKSADGLLVLKNEKQRDAQEAPDLGLKIAKVGESAVLELADLPTRQTRSTGLPQVPDTQSMLAWLAGQTEGATHREWMLGARVPKALFNRRLRKLTQANEIYKEATGRYFTMPSIEDLAEDTDE